MSSSVNICNQVDWVGVKHPDLKVFDELFPTHNGTTYNSYLIRGSEKTALIDTVKAPFADEFFGKVGEHVPPEKVDLVVVNHTEPDHSGSIGTLLEKNPDIMVYCTKAAENFLKQLLNREFNCHVISEGEEVDLGGKTLRFIPAPYLHWPDTMFTYLVEDEVLFPCDAFGAHYCAEKLFDDEIADFSHDFLFYFDCIMRPFKDKIRDAVKKIDGLPIKMVCPSHGPIRRSGGMAAIDSYRRWAAPPPVTEKPKAVMAVLSSHGNTRDMAAVVKDELEKQGLEISTFALCDMRDDDYRNALEVADVLIIGTPTIQRDAPPHVWHALSLISSVTPKARLGAIFGSFGWSGEAVKMVEQRLQGLKYKLAAESISCRFTPTEENLDACKQFAEQVASAVLCEE
ncbi:MAG: FprA family A-type flavoprotein [Desulfuromonas sp.]|nr:MAG: FprA family A-type flavoprotein [Desulfuromonas sp.]